MHSTLLLLLHNIKILVTLLIFTFENVNLLQYYKQ